MFNFDRTLYINNTAFQYDHMCADINQYQTVPRTNIRCLSGSFISALPVILLFLIHITASAQQYKRCQNYPGFPEPNPALGNTYYVSTTGNNNNPGTLGAPWKTVKHAMSQMQPGDITYIRAGIYNETNLKFDNSGMANKPITLSAYINNNNYEEVIIDGNANNLSWGIIIENGSYYTIQGLILRNFTRQGITTQETSGPYIGIKIRDVEIYNIGINQTDAGHNGMYLSNIHDFILENVSCHNNRGAGVLIKGYGDMDTSYYAQNGWVVNSFSYDNNDFLTSFTSDADGFYFGQARDIAVCNCYASNNSDQGFDVSDPEGMKGGLLSNYITMENNVATECPTGFSANSDSHHLLFMRNLAYKNTKGFIGYAGVGGLKYFHNVAMCNQYQGVEITNDYAYFEDPGDNTIDLFNNIFFKNNAGNGGAYEIEIAYDSPDPINYQIEASHNDFITNYNESVLAFIGPTGYTIANMQAFGQGNLNVFPVFVNSSCDNPDTHLDGSSPLIDAGVPININGLQESYSGLAPEIGMFENSPSGLNGFAPSKFNIKASPNPFNSFTLLSFDNPAAIEVTAYLFDNHGIQMIPPVKTRSNEVIIPAPNSDSGSIFYLLVGAGQIMASGTLIKH